MRKFNPLNLLFILTILRMSVFSIDYYVDNNPLTNNHTNANANQGTQLFPYTSHREINNHAKFEPGDRIFLRRGNKYKYSDGFADRNGFPGRWDNTYGVISPQGSGLNGNPITIDAWGPGTNLPEIDAEGNDFSAGFLLKNQDNWVIRNLEIKNFPSSTPPAHGIRWGIMVFFNRPEIDGVNGDLLRTNIRIENNYIHHVFATNIKDEGMTMSAGIFVIVDPDILTNYNSTTPPNQRISGVLIEGNRVEEITGEGIVFLGETHHHDAMNWNNLSSNVIVRNNSTFNTCNGIVVYGVDNPLIEYNVVNSAGGTGKTGNPDTASEAIAGLWTGNTRNGLIQYNEVMNTRRLPGDGIGLHHDVVHSGTAIYQYNYSHNNEGGFLSGSWPWEGDEGDIKVVFRYNVSINDRSDNKFNSLIGTGNSPIEVYNNTIISNTPITITYSPNPDPSFPQPAGVAYFANNIFFSESGDANFVQHNAMVYENNLYSKNILDNNNENLSDNNPLYSDEIFEAPEQVQNGITNIKGYQLNANSGGINSGIKILNDGRKDFTGKNQYGLTDIGAFEKPNIFPIVLTPIIIN